jgi:hypothetical protein
MNTNCKWVNDQNDQQIFIISQERRTISVSESVSVLSQVKNNSNINLSWHPHLPLAKVSSCDWEPQQARSCHCWKTKYSKINLYINHHHAQAIKDYRWCLWSQSSSYEQTLPHMTMQTNGWCQWSQSSSYEQSLLHMTMQTNGWCQCSRSSSYKQTPPHITMQTNGWCLWSRSSNKQTLPHITMQTNR